MGWCVASVVQNLPARAEVQSETVPDIGWGSRTSYPEWLKGDWDATSQLFAVEAPQGVELAGESALRARVALGTGGALALERYPLRFISKDSQIISDLAVNARPMLKGLGAVGAATSTSWDAFGAEPEKVDLRLERSSGFAFRLNMRRYVNELFPNEKLVSGGRVFLANEFFYAKSEAPQQTTPLRCVSKFRPLNGGKDVQLLQRVEIYPSVSAVAEVPGTGTAVLIGDAPGDLTMPIAKYKNRVHLSRVGSPPLSVTPCDESPPCGYPFNSRNL